MVYKGVEIAKTSTIAINTVGSNYIPNYLKRKRKIINQLYFQPVKRRESLKDLTVTRDRNRLNLLKFIESNFEQNLIEVAQVVNDDFNTELLTLTHIFLGNDNYFPVHDITVKQLQTLLKTALGKTSTTEFERKLGISNFDPDCTYTESEKANIKCKVKKYFLQVDQ